LKNKNQEIMNNLFIYLAQSGLNLTLMYAIFWLSLRNAPFFRFNRIYLLGAIVLSVFLPLINLKIHVQSSESGYVYLLNAIVITPGEMAGSVYEKLSFSNVLWIIYFSGAGFFLFRFILQLLRLGLMIVEFGMIKKNGLNIIITNYENSAFSFFHFIFLGTNNNSQHQIDKIIAHERVHIQQFHSLDIILLELLTIIQWCNPFIWLYRQTIKSLHEFLADEGVLAQGMNKSDYQKLLFNQTFEVQFYNLTNNFNHSLIKRRFIMMSKVKKNKQLALKVVLILPVSISILLFLSISFTPQIIAQDAGKTGVTKREINKADQPQEEDVFTVVEKMPEYPGGDDARVKFMVENIKYPEEARKNGVQGTVYVTFIVEKDGKVSNIKIIRGIGGGCDEEAVRVISLMPSWKPGFQRGKPVRVQFNMPVKFALDNGEKKVKAGEDSKEITPPGSPEKK
jgi:TonB family protein